jgi:hypothetical protein
VFSAFQGGTIEYDSIMLRQLLSIVVLTASAAVQASQPITPALSPPQPAIATPAPAANPAPTAAATPTPTRWDPAAPYITAGQDEPGYRSWYIAAPWRAAQVKAFNDYLVANQVGGILPTWQLLRTATSWQECGGQPFEVPPADEWAHMVETLRYVRDYVVPAVGPVEPVSVYRNPVLNKCAGGAPESAHKQDSAIDMVPLKPITRETLMRTLCGIHTDHGAAYNAGLGFYAYLRFHVDSTKFRRWNMDPAVAADCAPIVHPEDIASVGQPLPAATPTAASAVIPAAPAANAPAAASVVIPAAPAANGPAASVPPANAPAPSAPGPSATPVPAKASGQPH